MSSLRIRLLGTMKLQHGGQPVPAPPTLKSQSLLAYVVMHRDRPQSRDRLAGLFWGDRPERNARQSLATALWHIRRCLPKEAILADSHTVQFDPQTELWLDVDEFEALLSRGDATSLKSAVTLYAGDLLDGFYDDWILDERYRLETLLSNALERLMAHQEMGGEHAGALTTALHLLRMDPLREDAHRQAMRAHCQLGQRNAALEQYRRCQAVVREELGAEPMPETTALYRAILAGRFTREALHQPAVSQAGVPEIVPSPGRNPLDIATSGKLVGRERELEFLQGRWHAARDGQGGVVLISGEAGVGKTRLAAELASRARWQSARVVWGRCYEFERSLPYQPIADALRSVMPSLAPTELEALAPWAITEVARLIPEMADQYAGPAATAAVESSRDEARLYDGVACFLRYLSSREALLMVVEDLHWASESTLQMLHYLARHLPGQAILLLGTQRAEVLGGRHPLRSLHRQLAREGLLRTLHLPRLSPQAMQALVLEMSGAGTSVAPLAERLYRETEGNPFFLMETVKTLFEEGLIHLERGAWRCDFARLSRADLPLPGTLSEAIQARVDTLGDDAQEVLRWAAMLGREFDLDLLNLVCGRGEEATLEALDVLLRRRLLEEGSGVRGRDYAFAHHKIQEVVYSGIRGRRLLHRRVADAMEQLQPDDAVALAWHLEHAREPGRAARYAMTAGLASKAVFAHAEARVHFDRALALLKQEEARPLDPAALAANQRLRIRALDARGWCLRLLGSMQAYDRDLEEVARLAQSLCDPRILAHLRWREAYTHRWFCRYGQAREAAEDGVRLGQQAADPTLEAMCLREVGMAARATGDYDQAQEALERALDLFAGQSETVYEVHALGNLSTLFWCTSEYGRALDLARRALALCLQTDLPLERRLPLGDMGAALAQTGNTAEARLCLVESLSIARQIADRTQEILCLGHLGWLCILEKEPIQALEHLQAALTLAEEIGSQTEQSWLLSGLARALGALGNLEGAANRARQALELAHATCRAYDLGLAHEAMQSLGFDAALMLP